MPKPPPVEYRNVMDAQRARLDRLIDRRGTRVIGSLYREAHDELVRKLGQSGRASATMTSYQQRVLLAQVKVGETRIAGRMSSALGDASREAQEESLRAVSKDIHRLEKKFTGATVQLPLDEAARFRGIIDKRRTSLLRAHDTSMARYGTNIVQKVEKELSLSLMTGETASQAIDRIAAVADLEWWQGERIVRTEMAWAFNATHADGIKEVASELEDMMMRWSENVDDESYEPLDDRVGVDSIAMHGQLAKPGGMFVMPPTAPSSDAKGHSEVPPSLVGESWAFPPNRPNDRAVLAPWRPDWGVPGWVWRGRRVPFFG